MYSDVPLSEKEACIGLLAVNHLVGGGGRFGARFEYRQLVSIRNTSSVPRQVTTAKLSSGAKHTLCALGLSRSAPSQMSRYLVEKDREKEEMER